MVSTKAHARILNVDPSKALQMQGVVDYVSWKDIPGENKHGVIIQDEKVFAENMACVDLILKKLFIFII